MRIITIILFLVSLNSLCGQELHSRNKKAIANYQKAKSLSDIGNLYQSEELILSALKRDDSFDEAILLLHQIYIRKGNLEKSSEVLSQYRSEIDQPFVNRILSDQLNYFFEEGEYSKAKEILNGINGEIHGIPQEVFEMLSNSVEYAVQQIKYSTEIRFESLPKPINEFGMQYFPAITASGKLVFTVRENSGRGDENLYFSLDSIGHWTKPKPISQFINTDRNEGTASISADGSTLVFTACNVPGNIGSCDLYISYFDGKDWLKPELLGIEVNSIEWDSQPALSRDGKELYFVSKRSGGFGGQDIWYSKKTLGGWTKAENLGLSVNTKYDDCSPYIYIDKKTLVFASKGRVGMGSFDLFISTKENELWSEPLNLGYPINNSFDQVGYAISHKGWAYYSSSEESGKIELKRFKIPAGLLPSVEDRFISGLVLDEVSLQPLKANIKFEGPDSNKLTSVSTEIASGAFSVFVEYDTYFINVKAVRYHPVELTNSEFKKLKGGTLLLKPFKVGQKIEVRDVNFDFNSAELKDKSLPILDEVISFIQLNPELIIEVGGHTDTIGKEKPNYELSVDRAKSVYRYFVSKGLPKENLVFKGYGESRPVSAQKDNEESVHNRRIEFRIAGFLK